MILEHFKEFNKFGVVGKPRQWNIKMAKIWKTEELNWPVWLNGWVFVYKLSVCVLESHCSNLEELNFKKMKIKVSNFLCEIVWGNVRSFYCF